jgi:hypothetical protein
MEKILNEWVKKEGATMEELALTEEVCLNESTFKDGKWTKEDWETLFKLCPSVAAVQALGCDLTEIACPPENSEQIEVLDLTDNNLGSIDFCASLPKLASLIVRGNSKLGVSSLQALEKLDALKLLELEELPKDEADEDIVRTKIFELLPNLAALNMRDREGNMMAAGDEEDDLMMNALTEEDLMCQFAQALDTGDLDDGLEEEEADEEPAAKKAKTE